MRQLRRGAVTVLLIVPYVISQEAWAENEAEASTAGNKVVELPAVSVTATRTEREIDLTSKPVTIITREQIEARNARTVVELLADVPGVSFSRAGGLVGQAVVHGFNTNDPRALLSIESDRFRGRNTLEYTLLDPNQIERIEVIRGPASTLYGPDALAGVINIITRRAQGDPTGAFGLKVRLRALNFNRVNDLYGGRAGLEGLSNGVDLLLGINGRTANDYESPEGTISNSDFETLSTDLRLGYTPILDHCLELTTKYAEVAAGDAGGITGRPRVPLLRVCRDPTREHFIKLGYTGEDLGLGLEQIQASVYARELFTNIPSENRTIPNRLTELENIVDGPLVIGGKLLGTLPWGDNLLTMGTDFFHEDRKGTESSRRVTNICISLCHRALDRGEP
jgi:hemoglobin/transferrin/lactoferrin receptor protein